MLLHMSKVTEPVRGYNILVSLMSLNATQLWSYLWLIPTRKRFNQLRLFCRNVKEESGGRKEGGKNECTDVSPSHSYSLQMQQSGAEPAYHCCWWLTGSHTHKHAHPHAYAHTHTHSDITSHSSCPTRRGIKSRAALQDATGCQPLSKSTLPPLSVSLLSVVIACLSSFVSHTLLCLCDTASVVSDWGTFHTFSPLYALHIPHSPLTAFLFSACERTWE